jgi:hypothetical protein
LKPVRPDTVISVTNLPIRDFTAPVTEKAMQGSCSLEFEKRGILKLSRRVYSFEADPFATTFRRVETEIYISSSGIDGSVHGGAL